jgi:hypothetical protein
MKVKHTMLVFRPLYFLQVLLNTLRNNLIILFTMHNVILIYSSMVFFLPLANCLHVLFYTLVILNKMRVLVIIRITSDICANQNNRYYLIFDKCLLNERSIYGQLLLSFYLLQSLPLVNKK